MMVKADIEVRGIVQGVGFRPFVYRTAVSLELKGFVRNRGDAGVEIVIEGEDDKVQQFIKILRENPPPLASIDDVKVKYDAATGLFKSFLIDRSVENRRHGGSIIPPDISICDDCIKELRDPTNRRFEYFFITCTNCGPRYTIIESLPYDRPNTSMQDFPMCTKCVEEYRNPGNRRYHAQTIACGDCGPRVYLTDNEGKEIEDKDPIRLAGKLLEEGSILAIKGNGGFHFATATTFSEPIMKLRRRKNRPYKPFAIMARDLTAVKSFAEVSEYEANLLTSYIKPIVLLRKRKDYYLSELISPGLENIGVMLPYTGLHLMLFDKTNEPAFVMTSANPSGEPITIDNNEALTKLSKYVDYFLLHNRRIVQRCDDSVVRFHEENPVIIRRSRGYAPAPVYLRLRKDHPCILGCGSEENVTFTILHYGKAFLSQYIGNIRKYETFQYYKQALSHLARLTNSEFEVVACDYHPKFNTTLLAKRIAEEKEIKLLQVQHHFAHAASVAAEHAVDKLIVIVLDGFGLGLDGHAWGGEVIYVNKKLFKRIGHLQPQPLIGGDLATKYPLRLAIGILKDEPKLDTWISSLYEIFPHGVEEVKLILRQAESGRYITTTGAGRFLDAVSATLGICYVRTYEGEPAIKLEAAASGGKDVLKMEPIIENNIVNTSEVLKEIFAKKDIFKIKDLAYSAEHYLAKSISELAIRKAEELNIDTIGLSGGVAYNAHIFSEIKKEVKQCGFNFVSNRRVPLGDGGVSFGQAYFALLNVT
ncbi:MAG: carbamoyltransferase HypF [Candidatus Odinarchaeia archaeon]